MKKWNLLKMFLALQSLGVVEGGEAGVETTTEKKKRAPKTNLLDIVRGRMPLACVAAIRFHVKEDVSNGDVAKIFGTSVGKVFDIRKGRNFGYITADYKPSESDLTEAAKWASEAAKHGGDEAAVMAAVDKLGKATEDEAKAQAEKISASRSKGPRQPKAKPEGEQSNSTKTAAELLK